MNYYNIHKEHIIPFKNYIIDKESKNIICGIFSSANISIIDNNKYIITIITNDTYNNLELEGYIIYEDVLEQYYVNFMIDNRNKLIKEILND